MSGQVGMAPPEGYRPNGRYAAGRACPECGSMLIRMDPPAVRFSPVRIAADDREITRRSSDGFKSVESVTGYRHVCTLRCPSCGRLWSGAQSVEKAFAPSRLPRDFWVRDVPDTPEYRALAAHAGLEALRAAARSRAGRAAGLPREPVQSELPATGFRQAAGGVRASPGGRGA